MLPKVCVCIFLFCFYLRGGFFCLGQQFSEEFGKISSVRKVPVMKDGNFILTERYSGVCECTSLS